MLTLQLRVQNSWTGTSKKERRFEALGDGVPTHRAKGAAEKSAIKFLDFFIVTGTSGQESQQCRSG